MDVGYNIADKNYGAVVYSIKLFKEHCLLHLEDGKGTYCKTFDQTREDILEEILSLLHTILIPFKNKAWDGHMLPSQSFVTRAQQSREASCANSL